MPVAESAPARRSPAYAKRRLPALAGAFLALSVGTAALPPAALAFDAFETQMKAIVPKLSK